ncbi:alpha/beta fold hydrolase [Oleiphilus messinensis]|uniref:alpha/beta fold hydrolase n=1 Tax=Oleiphilus messinensis TaxID=141451 RepID=UPI001E46894A|nr:alpha/beta hydrolase [Oleiphilus messinensis]
MVTLHSGIRICYQDLGPEEGPVLLLIMGLACQMTAWPPALVDEFLAKGYRVVLFDNRDIGLSSEIKAKLKLSPPVAFMQYKMGLSVEAPYSLYDMADDVVGLLDLLAIKSAHAVGISMGGMITQILAARHPERIQSASILMSSDNHPRRNPGPELKALWVMNGSGVKGHHLEAAKARSLAFWRVVQSPGFAVSEADIELSFERNYHRSYRPAGILRQMRAIMATGALSHLHRYINTPVLIIHGDADPLVRPACGKRLHERISGSRMEMIQGLGHDLPGGVLPKLVSLIDGHVSAQ